MPVEAAQLVAFQEVIGFSAARVDSVFAELEGRLERGAPPHSLCGISPHAPYTVHPQLLERLVALARARVLPVAMHLAESREELELLADNRGPLRALLEARSMWDPAVLAGGLRPLDYLEVLARAPRALVVHGNYLSQQEIEFVAARRATLSVVYCPRTHAFFGHTAYPLAALLAAGARVALGTDSRASNPDLDLLGELRAVAARHAAVAPETIFRLGTLAGAEALGLADQVGSLTPGKLANCIALPCPASAPLEAILAGQQSVEHVWLHGRLQPAQ
jgi:cytosine/adenosine deaminase-related metal-dependent hydrolase